MNLRELKANKALTSLELFAEMHRVLKPGGLAIMSFSNRCFPCKAVRCWLESDEMGRLAIMIVTRTSNRPSASSVSDLTFSRAPAPPTSDPWRQRKP
jgi:SAM-dependent methyltransferase